MTKNWAKMLITIDYYTHLITANRTILSTTPFFNISSETDKNADVKIKEDLNEGSKGILIFLFIASKEIKKV